MICPACKGEFANIGSLTTHPTKYHRYEDTPEMRDFTRAVVLLFVPLKVYGYQGQRPGLENNMRCMLCKGPTDSLVRFADIQVLNTMQKMVMDIPDTGCPTSGSQAASYLSKHTPTECGLCFRHYIAFTIRSDAATTPEAKFMVDTRAASAPNEWWGVHTDAVVDVHNTTMIFMGQAKNFTGMHGDWADAVNIAFAVQAKGKNKWV
ncbi:hypothetical protein WJX79_010142 [Trebouxia sp. C0005]